MLNGNAARFTGLVSPSLTWDSLEKSCVSRLLHNEVMSWHGLGGFNKMHFTDGGRYLFDSFLGLSVSLQYVVCTPMKFSIRMPGKDRIQSDSHHILVLYKQGAFYRLSTICTQPQTLHG